MSNESIRATALDWIGANQQRLSDFNARIWSHAEPAWREYESARDYVELLRAEGFTVEAGSGGMPTAFVATWGEGAPVLASFSEYDAVPGNSQQAVPYPAPREGLHPYAAGHTDPHSVLGTAALAAILGAKRGDAEAWREGPAQAVRRAGGEGLRIEAGPCRQGLLRRARRRGGLAPLAAEHRDGRDSIRRLLERGDHLRGRPARDTGSIRR
jgi:hypothetical protein